MSKRRPKGEGSITQRHDHPTCPPLEVVGHDEDGKPIKERPEHRCQGRWCSTVDLGWAGGKRQRRTYYGRTQKEVQVKLKTAMRERDQGVLVSGSPTVEKWLNYWLDVICVERGLKVNTMKSHRSKVNQYLIPHLGRHRLDRLAPEHVRAMYAAMRKKKLSEATLRQTHAILHRALKVAVRERKVAFNVAELIDPPKTDKERRKPLSLEDCRKVLRGAGLRVYLALYLGMRQAEVLGLRWSDVNLEEGFLFIERTLVREPGVGLVFDTPKSRTSKRPLPLPTVVLSRFQVAWAEHVNSGGTRDDLVFSDNGKPMDHRKDWQAWTDLLDSLGIEHAALHAARNTTASLLEAAGVPDRMVAEILGHSQVQITHNYQQADLARRGEALRALETYIELGD